MFELCTVVIILDFIEYQSRPFFVASNGSIKVFLTNFAYITSCSDAGSGVRKYSGSIMPLFAEGLLTKA